MEIRKSDKTMLMDIAIWLSEKPCPSSETVEAVKNSIFAHLEATRGEPNTETTRLLAAKFVADEAVGLVGELVGALSNVCKRMGWSDDHDLDYIDYIGAAKSALAKAAQFTAAGTGPAVGGATEPVIFPPGEVEAVPEYVPYWPMIPERFDHVAVDKDRMVFAYIGRPKQRHGCEWWPESEAEEDFTYLAEILTPVGETWQKMVYKRPE